MVHCGHEDLLHGLGHARGALCGSPRPRKRPNFFAPSRRKCPREALFSHTWCPVFQSHRYARPYCHGDRGMRNGARRRAEDPQKVGCHPRKADFPRTGGRFLSALDGEGGLRKIFGKHPRGHAAPPRICEGADLPRRREDGRMPATFLCRRRRPLPLYGKARSLHARPPRAHTSYHSPSAGTKAVASGNTRCTVGRKFFTLLVCVKGGKASSKWSIITPLGAKMRKNLRI